MQATDFSHRYYLWENCIFAEMRLTHFTNDKACSENAVTVLLEYNTSILSHQTILVLYYALLDVINTNYAILIPTAQNTLPLL